MQQFVHEDFVGECERVGLLFGSLDGRFGIDALSETRRYELDLAVRSGAGPAFTVLVGVAVFVALQPVLAGRSRFIERSCGGAGPILANRDKRYDCHRTTDAVDLT